MTGYCQCGCGLSTKRLTRTVRGLKAGDYQRFVCGHNRKLIGTSGPYKRIANKGESRCVHVVIAEAALGRKLPDGATVHHVDDNKRNNTNTNLVICQDQAYHVLLHVRARVVRAGGDPNTQAICRTCGHCKDFSEFYPSVKTQCMACKKRIDAQRWKDGKFKNHPLRRLSNNC